ncbi:MAG TPA: MFS transporter [Thermoplasmata archaeon]|nr:MFS transporter [Thermoplasmata archaeon]
MTELHPNDRRFAAVMLVIGRIAYAFNWYNVGAVLPFIEKGLNASTGQLGIVLGAFLVGAGIFQVPAGLIAIRWGYRTTSIFALLLMGAFCLASAAAPDWVVLALLRFGAGAGAAFFFAPALGLVSSYYPAGARGPVIGIYNSGFAIGAAVGLFAGALVGVTQGWPWALAYGGIALLIMGLGAAVTLPPLPRGNVPESWRATWRVGRPILGSRTLWALSLGLSGMWASFYIAASYFVQFAHTVHPEWPIILAAGLPTVLIIAEVFGGPIGGWFAEHGSNMRRILVLWGIGSALGLALIPFLPQLALWPLFVFLGFANGVLFAVQYLIVTYLPEGRGENTALAIGFLNSVQLFIGSLFAIIFGILVGVVGYMAGWLFAGALLAAFLPMLRWVRVQRSGPAVPVSASRPS